LLELFVILFWSPTADLAFHKKGALESELLRLGLYRVPMAIPVIAGLGEAALRGVNIPSRQAKWGMSEEMFWKDAFAGITFTPRHPNGEYRFIYARCPEG